MNSNNFLPLLTKRIAYTLLFIKHLKINEENVVKKSAKYLKPNISSVYFLKPDNHSSLVHHRALMHGNGRGGREGFFSNCYWNFFVIATTSHATLVPKSTFKS